MKNKGLWILLAINVVAAIVFYVAILKQNPGQTNQFLYILEMMLGFIIIEIPIAFLISKSENKNN